jgi:hypothetical protein
VIDFGPRPQQVRAATVGPNRFRNPRRRRTQIYGAQDACQPVPRQISRMGSPLPGDAGPLGPSVDLGCLSGDSWAGVPSRTAQDAHRHTPLRSTGYAAGVAGVGSCQVQSGRQPHGTLGDSDGPTSRCRAGFAVKHRPARVRLAAAVILWFVSPEKQGGSRDELGRHGALRCTLEVRMGLRYYAYLRGKLSPSS